MKKYSTDYFEKKYKILAEKLLQKEGFLDAIKATRAELGLPEDGFTSTQELAFFLIGKMSKEEQMSLTLIALHGKKLEFAMRSPFNLMLNRPDNLTVRRERDSNSRALARRQFSKLLI
jgi:hypothetical protein